MTFAVTDAASGRLLGDGRAARAATPAMREIGYWTAPWARGQGVMTAAARLACRFGFDVLGLERIEWWAAVGNDASRRVAEKVGFTVEGTCRARLPHRGERLDGWVGGLLAGRARLMATDAGTRCARPARRRCPAHGLGARRPAGHRRAGRRREPALVAVARRHAHRRRTRRGWVAERSGPGPDRLGGPGPGHRALVGRTSLHRFTTEPASAEIGYGVHPAHRRRGVAVAAVATAVALRLRRARAAPDRAGARRRQRRVLRGGDPQRLRARGRRAAGPRVPRRTGRRPAPARPARHRPARAGRAAVPRPLEVPELSADGRAAAAVDAPTTPPPCCPGCPTPRRPAGARRRRRSTWPTARAWIAGRFRRRAAGGQPVVLGRRGGRRAWPARSGCASVNPVDRWASGVVLDAARPPAAAASPARALDLATSYAVRGLGLHRVQLQHALDNTASCRVAEKAGLRAGGRSSAGPACWPTGFVDEHLHARVAGA